jgi:hypothetical protein
MACLLDINEEQLNPQYHGIDFNIRLFYEKYSKKINGES